MKKYAILFLALSVVVHLKCTPGKPVVTDGNSSVEIAVLDTTGTISKQTSGNPIPVSRAEVVLSSREYQRDFRQCTASDGIARFEGLPASRYDVTGYFAVDSYLSLTGSISLNLGEISICDTLRLHKLSASPLLITEICYAGNADHNCMDQFIEIYNRTDSTVFLDGMVIGKVATDSKYLPDPETVDFVRTNKANRFPGISGGKTLPLYAGEKIVIAVAAGNYKAIYPHALDLSGADFELHNPLGFDFDNPDVPNLENIIPTTRTDFLLNYKSGAIVLSDGSDGVLTQDYNYLIDRLYFDIPVSTIIDGVEYKQNSETVKYMTRLVDAGFAGIGILSYRGMSVERITPERDSNNSNVDFQILDTPTPGQ